MNTFKRNDSIKDVLWGYNSKSIMSADLVHEDFTMTWQGKFFFINVSKTMIPTQNARLSLALSHGFVFQLFIHDPYFFEINYQPTFPAILKTIKPAMEYNQYHSILLTEVCFQKCAQKRFFANSDVLVQSGSRSQPPKQSLQF